MVRHIAPVEVRVEELVAGDVITVMGGSAEVLEVTVGAYCKVQFRGGEVWWPWGSPVTKLARKSGLPTID